MSKPKKRTGAGRGLRLKIKGPWTHAIRDTLRKEEPPEGWPKTPAAPPTPTPEEE